ncbi:hypothetical protein CaCOL14_007178 [Colletotrichum acutatum]|uniref:Uncharacterized protein n=1 Tax=Glomerella acutata TaxID=27357 RepID=A0AAD8XDZ4_GLOAC|nr:uncharacterized protein BDZ83DRAFT_625741 [Colletotrichum acutatum]KAK1723672.1 hypothetical protein BDZ83DRAFT_625741 [Colletotrichum acutatum]
MVFLIGCVISQEDNIKGGERFCYHLAIPPTASASCLSFPSRNFNTLRHRNFGVIYFFIFYTSFFESSFSLWPGNLQKYCRIRAIMAMPSVSNSSNCNGEWQYIHCKVVKSPQGLSSILTSLYGPGKFSVETRQNVYCIRAADSTVPLDLARPDVRDSLNGKVCL